MTEGRAHAPLESAGSCRSPWAGRTCRVRCPWTARPDLETPREPVPGVLLLADGGWLLLDTGYNTALITDPALRARFHGDPLVQPVLPGPGEPLAEALDAAGVDPADIPRGSPSSHLHYDHAGGLQALRRPGAGCTSSGAELDYGMSSPPGPEENRHLTGWTSTIRGSTGGPPRATRRSLPA